MSKGTGEMPFLDHLEELRSRILKVLLALVITIGIGLFLVLHYDAIAWMKAPIAPYLPDGKLVVQKVTDQVAVTFKLGTVLGLVLASPVIIYQLWAFLSPALYDRERRLLMPALVVGLGLFLTGAWVAWSLVLPKMLVVLMTFQADYVLALITYDFWFSFVVQTMLGFGISFELPLVMVILTALGIVDARRYHAFRRYWLVLALIAGAFLSPGPDVIFMMISTLPLLALYEVGYFGAMLVQRRRRLPSGTTTAALIVASLIWPVAAGAQDVRRPPVRDNTPARQIDSASAKRLGLPTAPSRAFPGPDSVMQALLSRKGFAITRYLGDSALMMADSQRIVLSGEAATLRDGGTMEAARIVYDDGRCELVASGEPKLFEEDRIAIGRVIRFDTCAERGVFEEAFTTFDELGSNWFVRGKLAVDSSARRLYAAHGEFTSCDLPLAHYHFQAGEVKWMSESFMVARPATLFIRDVPVVWIPFLFQDTKPGRRSGILIPQFGFNDIVRPTRGYNRQITNIGYYWAPNDYVDVTARLDWFSSRYIQYGGEFRYDWRDRFVTGGIGVNRQVELGGGNSMQLRWNHNQRFSAATTLVMNLNYASDSRIIAGNAVDPLLTTQQISSALNFTRRFSWGNLTIGGTRNQNVTDGSGQMTLPSLSLSPNPVAITDNISWAPAFSVTNATTFKQRLAPEQVFTPGGIDTLELLGSSRNTTMGFDTPITVGRTTLTNRFTIQDRLEQGRRSRTVRIPDLSTPDPADSISVTSVTGGDFASAIDWNTGVNLPSVLSGSWKVQPSIGIRNVTSGGFMIRNAASRGRWVQQSKRLELAASAAPSFFGFLQRGIGPYDRFRHTVAPSIRAEWSPEASVPEEYASAIGLGTAIAPPRMAVSVGLQQDFQAKPRIAPNDTTTDPQTVVPVTLLSISTSAVGYDFEQAKLDERSGWVTATITNSFRSDLISGLNVSLTHDLWEGQVGSDTARFSPFLSNAQANFTLTSRTFRSLAGLLGLGGGNRGRQDMTPPAEAADSLPAQYTVPSDRRFRPGSFATPDPMMGMAGRGDFTASIAYSYSRQRVAGMNALPPVGLPGDIDDPLGSIIDPLPTFSGNRSSLSLNTSFSPTPFWNVSWNTQFNITDGQFESHRLELSRDLHDWRAAFNFARNANGNFALYFNIYLLSLPDIKFDYNQTTLQP